MLAAVRGLTAVLVIPYLLMVLPFRHLTDLDAEQSNGPRRFLWDQLRVGAALTIGVLAQRTVPELPGVVPGGRSRKAVPGPNSCGAGRRDIRRCLILGVIGPVTGNLQQELADHAQGGAGDHGPELTQPPTQGSPDPHNRAAQTRVALLFLVQIHAEPHPQPQASLVISCAVSTG